MIKQAPSIGRMVAMVVFTLSCFGLLLFLWLAFGGSIPLRPEGYRFKVAFPEAATLAQEADVRMAGVNVGKVKTKELDKGASRTLVELELDEQFAPIPKDSRAILRQKTLLGETYVGLSQGDKRAGMLRDGETLPNSAVEPTVEIDEIFSAFDEETRSAFQQWVTELSKAIDKGRDEDLNDVFGNFEGFAVDGATLLETLDEQEVAVRRLIKNTGAVFGALNEREGALRELIVNSNNTFEATASRDEALAQTFEVFPTFLDESKVTLVRLERFSRNTRPLVNTLKGPADDLGPTVRNLGELAPDLERLFRDIDPLIRASERGVPALERILEEAEPLFAALHPFLQELNPVLSYLNFHQSTIAGFISNGAPDISGDFGGERYQTNVAIIEGRSFEKFTERQDWERGNAYMSPNALQRSIALGTIESFDCRAAGGEKPDPDDQENNSNPATKEENKRVPCFVQPGSLYNGKSFVIPTDSRKVNAPGFRDGTKPAVDPRPNDPLK